MGKFFGLWPWRLNTMTMARARKTEVVTLECIAKNPGATISKENYVTVSNFIINALASKSDQRMTLNDLLEQAQKEISHAIPGNMFWYLLHVKLDLEAKEIVTVIVDRSRVQHVKLVRIYQS